MLIDEVKYLADETDISSIYSYRAMGMTGKYKYDYYDFNALTFSITIVESSDFDRKTKFIDIEYALESTFTKEAKTELLTSIKGPGLLLIERDYYEFGFFEESYWKMEIILNNGKSIVSEGNEFFPNCASKIDEIFLKTMDNKLLGIDIFLS